MSRCISADYHRLRVGGLILAAVLCLIGIMILLSELGLAHARACTRLTLTILQPLQA